MSFPLYILAIPYLLFLAVWAILSLIGFYHLFHFGKKITAVFLCAVYVVGALALLQISYDYLAPINWNTTVSIFNDSPRAPAFQILDF